MNYGIIAEGDIMCYDIIMHKTNITSGSVNHTTHIILITTSCALLSKVQHMRLSWYNNLYS